MPLSTRSVILKAPPKNDSLISQVDEVVRGWTSRQLYFSSAQRVENSPGMVVWVWTEPSKPGLEVRLVFDDLAGIRYVSVKAPDEDPNDLQGALLGEVAKAFTVFTVEELRDMARSEANASGVWMKLALGIGGAFDAETFQLVSAALNSPDLDVRRGAAEASALLQWPELFDPVSEAFDRERDESLKQLLGLAAMACSAAARQ
jgi:hypothetical protein